MVLKTWRLQALSLKRSYGNRPLDSIDRGIFPILLAVVIVRIAANVVQWAQGFQALQETSVEGLSVTILQHEAWFNYLWTALVAVLLFPSLVAASVQVTAFPESRIDRAPLSKFKRFWIRRGSVLSQPYVGLLGALGVVLLIYPAFVTGGAAGLAALLGGALFVYGILIWAIGPLSKINTVLAKIGIVVLAVLFVANPNFINTGRGLELSIFGTAWSLETWKAALSSGPSPTVVEEVIWGPFSVFWGAVIATVGSIFFVQKSYSTFSRWMPAQARLFVAPRGFETAFPRNRRWLWSAFIPWFAVAAWNAGFYSFDTAFVFVSWGVLTVAWSSWAAPAVSLHLPQSPSAAVVSSSIPPLLGVFAWNAGASFWIVGSVACVAAAALFLRWPWFEKRLRKDWEANKYEVLGR